MWERKTKWRGERRRRRKTRIKMTMTNRVDTVQVTIYCTNVK